MSTLKYWLWLTTRRGLRTRSALNVLEWFGSPERTYFADPAEYAHIPSLTEGEQKALQEKEDLPASEAARRIAKETGYKKGELYKAALA